MSRLQASSAEGYLVVLRSAEAAQPKARLEDSTPRPYEGVDRLPPWPSEIPEEADALWDYYFGGAIDDATNLIRDFNLAQRLATTLAAGPRSFEVVACGRELPSENSLICLGNRFIPLGYDVAGLRGNCWSIVKDMPASSWARNFMRDLNEFGLFSTPDLAAAYLQQYISHQEPDADAGLEVVAVSRAV